MCNFGDQVRANHGTRKANYFNVHAYLQLVLLLSALEILQFALVACFLPLVLFHLPCN